MSQGRKQAESTALTTRGVSLTALMRKRARDQFESVRRGEGPLAVGQLARKQENTTGESTQARPTSYTVHDTSSGHGGERICIQQKPLSAGYDSNIQPPARTIRVKASKQQLRPSVHSSSETSSALQSSSPNIPASTISAASKAQTPGTQHSRTAPRVPQNTPVSRVAPGVASAKTQQIAASPVMSAMLRSRIPQATGRSLTQQAHSPGLTPGNGKARFASHLAGSPIAGSGIKVKVASVQSQQPGTPTGARKVQQPVPGTIKTPASNSMRVKATPGSTSRPIVIKARPQ